MFDQDDRVKGDISFITNRTDLTRDVFIISLTKHTNWILDIKKY